uniref:Gamma-interferon inducible lysosomal thiol reductase n=1 Tax=Amblyomma aureolatum TaxID=187763 RepID=A0A1E1XIK9_9ACAR
MGVAGKAEKPVPKGPSFVKYLCIIVWLAILVLLAFSLARALSYLLAKRPSAGNATEIADVKSGTTDNSASHGILASSDDFKKVSPSAKNPRRSEPKPPPTTPSPTTPEPTATTRSPAKASTPVTATTLTTKEPSTETASSSGGSGGRHPRHVIGLSSTNHTNSSSGKEHVHGKKITLQVVYDCYCPRSRGFIVSQLLPVYEKLQDYLNLTLLPSSLLKNETARNSTIPKVECKPGSKECQSSMLQTCVMTHSNETLTAVKVIACMSSSEDPYEAGRACVEEYGLEWKLMDLCVTEKGQLYLLEVSQKVWRITGGVGRVPLVSVQGQVTRVVQVEAETNLLELVCDHMRHDHEACAGSRDGTALSTPGGDPENYSTTTQPSTSVEESPE